MMSNSHSLPPHLTQSTHPPSTTASFPPGFQLEQHPSNPGTRAQHSTSGQLLPGFAAGGARNREKDGWTAHRSGDLIYYHNTITGVSQWEKPVQFEGDLCGVSERPKPSSSTRILNTNWMEVQCEDGRTYYLNTESKDAMWSIPPEVRQAKTLAREVAHKETEKAPVVMPKVEMGPVMEMRVGRKATQEQIEDFRALLQEAGVSAYSRFEKEAQKLEDDERWQSVSLLRERKQLFDEFCKNAARQERESKHEAQIKFRQLLVKIRTEEIHEMQSLADVADESEMMNEGQSLSELFSDESTLDQLADEYENDPRWKDCSERVRKEIFSKFCQDLSLQRPRAVDRHLEQESKERDWRKRKEEGRVDRNVRESHRRLREASRATALSNYKTLLIEVVKHPNSSWSTMKEKLEADIQGRGKAPDLDNREKEKLFYEHVDEINTVAIRRYKKLLEENLAALAPTCESEMEAKELGDFKLKFTSFEEAEKVLVMDARTIQPSRDMKKRLWKHHVQMLEGQSPPHHHDDEGEDDQKGAKRRKHNSWKRSDSHRDVEETKSHH